MKMNMKINSELENILFKNERLEKLIECINALIEEDVVEISGTSENCFNYALYDILEGIRENNERLENVIEESVRIKEQQKESEIMEEREIKLYDIMDEHNCDMDVAEALLEDEEEEYEY